MMRALQIVNPGWKNRIQKVDEFIIKNFDFDEPPCQLIVFLFKEHMDDTEMFCDSDWCCVKEQIFADFLER